MRVRSTCKLVAHPALLCLALRVQLIHPDIQLLHSTARQPMLKENSVSIRHKTETENGQGGSKRVRRSSTRTLRSYRTVPSAVSLSRPSTALSSFAIRRWTKRCSCFRNILWKPYKNAPYHQPDIAKRESSRRHLARDVPSRITQRSGQSDAVVVLPREIYHLPAQHTVHASGPITRTLPELDLHRTGHANAQDARATTRRRRAKMIGGKQTWSNSSFRSPSARSWYRSAPVWR